MDSLGWEILESCSFSQSSTHTYIHTQRKHSLTHTHTQNKHTNKNTHRHKHTHTHTHTHTRAQSHSGAFLCNSCVSILQVRPVPPHQTDQRGARQTTDPHQRTA